jgi:hypothetical protein
MSLDPPPHFLTMVNNKPQIKLIDIILVSVKRYVMTLCYVLIELCKSPSKVQGMAFQRL